MIRLWEFFNNKKTVIGAAFAAFTAIWIGVDQILLNVEGWRNIVPAITGFLSVSFGGIGVTHKVQKAVKTNGNKTAKKG